MEFLFRSLSTLSESAVFSFFFYNFSYRQQLRGTVPLWYGMTRRALGPGDAISAPGHMTRYTTVPGGHYCTLVIFRAPKSPSALYCPYNISPLAQK